MPAPRLRSRSYRRIVVRTPGSRLVTHYKRRKPGLTHCSCGAVLKGVPRERAYRMSGMAKSYKKPERPYGGNLCSNCMRRLFVLKARA